MDRPRTCVATCMRNEGMFLMEWVAWQQLLGFDEIVIVTNDCEDGNDAMAKRLQKMGLATHVNNVPAEGDPPLTSGLRLAHAHSKLRASDWVLHCDADELLVIDHGEGRIHDLIEAMPGHTDLIALAWLPFGTSGLTDWPGGNVTELNTLCKERIDPAGFHKSMFRPNKFSSITSHMPKGPHGPVIARNGKGEMMNPRATRMEFAKFRGNPDELMTWGGARIHHYAIRAEDVFLMKNARGDGMNYKPGKYFLNSTFYQKLNQNERTDSAINRHMDELLERKATLLKDPVLRDLHEAAEAWFFERRKSILTPKRRAAWTKELVPQS